MERDKFLINQRSANKAKGLLGRVGGKLEAGETKGQH